MFKIEHVFRLYTNYRTGQAVMTGHKTGQLNLPCATQVMGLYIKTNETTIELLIKIKSLETGYGTTLVLISVDCPSLPFELLRASDVLEAVLSFLAATFAKLREGRTVGIKVGPEV